MIDFGTALRSAHASNPAHVPGILAAAAGSMGGTDLVAYLVDFGQKVLEPLPDRSAHAEVPAAEPITGTMAGRAFADQEIVTSNREGAVRVWVPLLEGSDPTGVVAVTVPSTDDDVLRDCRDLGLLAGYLIAVHARTTDLFNLRRRRRPMSLAASMQWDLLPPLLLETGAATVAGIIEPAYDVGGDCFDYAANGSNLDFAVMDAMGHGVGSALIASLAMGCYRQDRREAKSLTVMHTTLSSTIADRYADMSFVTGILARLDTATGDLTWTNAGHPLPLLIRQGRVVGDLPCPPTPPWGILPETEPKVASVRLEPGDSVLIYTDGVIEARTRSGEEFGLDRLTDLAQRHASDLSRPERIVRRIVETVLAHQEELTDDATAVFVRYAGDHAS